MLEGLFIYFLAADASFAANDQVYTKGLLSLHFNIFIFLFEGAKRKIDIIHQFSIRSINRKID